LALQAAGWSRTDAVRRVCSEPCFVLGKSCSVSARTIWRWLQAYEARGIEGLERHQRVCSGTSKVLGKAFLDYLEAARNADNYASIPELIRQARELGVLGVDEMIERSTVWRAMRRLDIQTKRRKLPANNDMRRFEYQERMQMLLLDGKHFRAGIHRSRRVALYLLDDATRFGLDVVVCPSEQCEAVLRLMYRAICLFGLMDCLFVDHGPGFIADDLVRILARLGVMHILGTAGYPEGHGKIERFNRSVKARALRSLDGNPEVDDDCASLTLRLRHDLHETYNHLPHESLGGESPYQRWTRGRALRPAASQAWLIEAFTLSIERKASKDHIVSVDGTSYELPRGHSGKPVTLYRRLLEQTPQGPALYIEHDARMLRLRPVDKHFNATERRARGARQTQDEVHPVPAKSASQMAYERSHRSLLDADGGFSDER